MHFPSQRSKVSRKPLYRQIADIIKQDYVDGQPSGTRLPTERKLEEFLGVSSITIRAALKELEIERYVERQQGSGTYVLERNLPVQHVGLLLEADIGSDQLSPYYLKLLQELRVALFKLGIPSRPYLGHLHLGLEIGELTCREILDDLRMDRLSGIISVLARKHVSWISEIRKRSIPLIGSQFSSDNVVDVDQLEVAAQTLEHFKARGRNRLAVTTWDDTKDAGSPPLHESPYRIQDSLRKVAGQLGFSLDNAFTLLDPFEPLVTLRWESFRAKWADPNLRPDCLLITEDRLFEGCQATLLEMGIRVPEDLEIVVCGSDAISLNLEFPVTRCLFSVRTKAQKMAEAMQKCLARQELEPFIRVPFSLVSAEPRSHGPKTRPKLLRKVPARG